MQDCMLHAGLRMLTGVSLCCLHAYINELPMAWRLYAGELHVNSAVFIARALEPVVGKHLWASNTAGQVW
jgi:hypothetical protein